MDLVKRRLKHVLVGLVAVQVALGLWRNLHIVKTFLRLFDMKSRYPFGVRLLDLTSQLIFKFVGLTSDVSKFSRKRWDMIQNLIHGRENPHTPCGYGIVWRDDVIPAEAGIDPAPELFCRVYHRQEDVEIKDPESVPVVLFLHGGGFCISSSAQADYHAISHSLAREGFCVVAPDYRLAPECPFPCQVVDVYRALKWTVDHAKLPPHADPSRIILLGDSAGGGLCAVLSSLARDKLTGHLESCEIQREFSIIHQVIIYGALFALNMDLPSQFEFTMSGSAPLLSQSAQDFFYNAYLPEKIRKDAFSDRRCCVWLAGLHDIPATTVVTAHVCPLRDENILYAKKLEEIGTPVKHHHYDDIHGFFTTHITRNTRDVFDKILQDIRQYL